MRSTAWLEHRFELFERFCLPSIQNQTIKSFHWIVLFDSSTPDRFKDIIKGYQKKCPQLMPIFVAPKNGEHFAEIFKDEVAQRKLKDR